MKSETPNILIVDDESQNLEIIREYLEDEAYHVETRQNSLEAWQELEAGPEVFDVILLDWMMPGLDGLAMLNNIKQHPQLKFIPVIMQTARTNKQDILRGMTAGAFYYLTKPYNQESLCSIINAALEDIQRFRQLKKSLQQHAPSQAPLNTAEFELRNLNEADQLASVLASSCPEPGKVIAGISELLINAIEHGNLNIGYAEKSELKKKGKWREEIEHRLQLPQYRQKTAHVKFCRNGTRITITITDQGEGFDWQRYLEFNPERAFDCNGRGIAMAKMLSFDDMTYNDTGNQVSAFINL